MIQLAISFPSNSAFLLKFHVVIQFFLSVHRIPHL
nr:MAG TPA: hypothetical protein [Caudoviricetes sp.]